MQRIPRAEEVEWIDHATYDESRPLRSRQSIMESNQDLFVLRTVGFRVGEDRQSLVLSPEIDQWGRFGASHHIMKKLILSRKVLQPARQIKREKKG